MATINEVLEAVGADPDLALMALEEERSSDKPRVTLVESLEKIIEVEDDPVEDPEPQDEVESNQSASGVRRSHFIEVGTPYKRMN